MNSIGAFVSDLDGTLLNADQSVPPQYSTFHRLLSARNIRFFVASARPLGSIVKLFEGHPAPSGIVACDGAIVASLKDGAIAEYVENALSNSSARIALAAIQSAGVHPILFLTRQHDYSVLIENNDETLLKALSQSDPTRSQIVMDSADLDSILSHISVRAVSAFSHTAEITKAFSKVYADMSQVENIKMYTYSETRFGAGMFAWLDVVNHSTRKEEAIKILLRFHGVENAAYFACGNGENDTAMLAAASLAFCPRNSAKSVQEVCHATTAPCDEGGEFVQWMCSQLTKSLGGDVE
jgi:HAD superfamily hydrolase (TIGR01484 family)